jgi:hypothetical protein
MFDDIKIPLRLAAAVGATVALFSTFLPWYSFGVVFPGNAIIHVFAVTTTLWGWTTLAPLLIVVGAAVALLFAAAVDGRLAGIVVALIGAAITAYAVVRCFEVPHLGVRAEAGARPVSELEGGPFVAIAGGLMLLIGGVGELLLASTRAERSRWIRRSGWHGPSTPPPHAVS